MEKILYIDDQVKNLKLFSKKLSARFKILTESCVFNIEKHLKEFRPDAIVLDIMMPVKSGFELYQEILSSKYYHAKIPIIFRSAYDSEKNILRSLSDRCEFLSSAMSFDEIYHRIKNQIELVDLQQTIAKFKDISVNGDSMVATFKGEKIKLTPFEFKILYNLIKTETLLSREQLINILWGSETGDQTNSFNTHLSNLRTKIKDKGYIIKNRRELGVYIDNVAL